MLIRAKEASTYGIAPIYIVSPLLASGLSGRLPVFVLLPKIFGSLVKEIVSQGELELARRGCSAVSNETKRRCRKGVRNFHSKTNTKQPAK